MGFEIEVKTGEMGPVTLRGCEDGTVEMCTLREQKNRQTGEPEMALVAFKYYASIEQAFDRVARMRVASTIATDLKQLTEAIRAIRLDIKRELGAANAN